MFYIMNHTSRKQRREQELKESWRHVVFLESIFLQRQKPGNKNGESQPLSDNPSSYSQESRRWDKPGIALSQPNNIHSSSSIL